MSYRPICDVWLLARPKSKYFGAYPAGFLRRARDLIGCSQEDQVLHVCSGDIANYKCGPGCSGNGDHRHGFGSNDITVDVDATVRADYHLDVRAVESFKAIANENQIKGVLADPPYTKQFAANYRVGPDVFPSANVIVKNALAILPVGRRVGILSMEWPRCPKATARQIAIVGVLVGNGNVGRWFAVYERTDCDRSMIKEYDDEELIPEDQSEPELQFEHTAHKRLTFANVARARAIVVVDQPHPLSFRRTITVDAVGDAQTSAKIPEKILCYHLP